MGFNPWMETTAAGGRAKPEYGYATGFNPWFLTNPFFREV